MDFDIFVQSTSYNRNLMGGKWQFDDYGSAEKFVRWVNSYVWLGFLDTVHIVPSPLQTRRRTHFQMEVENR